MKNYFQEILKNKKWQKENMATSSFLKSFDHINYSSFKHLTTPSHLIKIPRWNGKKTNSFLQKWNIWPRHVLCKCRYPVGSWVTEVVGLKAVIYVNPKHWHSFIDVVRLVKVKFQCCPLYKCNLLFKTYNLP